MYGTSDKSNKPSPDVRLERQAVLGAILSVFEDESLSHETIDEYLWFLA